MLLLYTATLLLVRIGNTREHVLNSLQGNLGSETVKDLLTPRSDFERRPHTVLLYSVHRKVDNKVSVVVFCNKVKKKTYFLHFREEER